MTTGVTSVAVYCGSSDTAPEIYKTAATNLGKIIAENSLQLIYGGGRMGLMGIVADACTQAGGYVVGYMTEFLNEFERGHEQISELHLVPNMHERKFKMFERADAFLIMPGGLGTLDEAFEVMTWKQIGLHKKPIIFIDINGYWSPLFETFVNHMIENKFVRENDRQLYMIIKSEGDVIECLKKCKINGENFVAKWG